MISNEDAISTLENSVKTRLGRWKRLQEKYKDKDSFIAKCLKDLQDLVDVADMLWEVLKILELPVERREYSDHYGKLKQELKHTAESAPNFRRLIRIKKAIDDETVLTDLKQDYQNYQQNILEHADSLQRLTNPITDANFSITLKQLSDDIQQIEQNLVLYKQQFYRLEPLCTEEESATKGITHSTVIKVKIATSNMIDTLKGFITTKPLLEFNEFITKLDVINQELLKLKNLSPSQVLERTTSPGSPSALSPSSGLSTTKPRSTSWFAPSAKSSSPTPPQVDSNMAKSGKQKSTTPQLPPDVIDELKRIQSKK